MLEDAIFKKLTLNNMLTFLFQDIHFIIKKSGSILYLFDFFVEINCYLTLSSVDSSSLLR